jgi:hypothetical protein
VLALLRTRLKETVDDGSLRRLSDKPALLPDRKQAPAQAAHP